MFPEELRDSFAARIARVSHPRELVVDFIFDVQDHCGYLGDEALEAVAELVGMSPLEVESIATFYTFVYREPVGKYVIHVCDSVICWMDGYESIREHLCRKLEIEMGETTPDGKFTLLPVCCIGYCDRSPAVLINKKVYGPLTIEKLDGILEKLKAEG
jgi:NADH-quinone oxidoreductase subunit E